MAQPRSNAPVLAAALLLLASCSSTSLDGTWMRPEFTERPIAGPVFVVGVARDETVRRVYEDTLAARLGAHGVAVVRSYEQLPGALDGGSNEALLAAAGSAGARYVLSTALIATEEQHIVTEEPVGYVGGYRGWYGPRWGVSYSRTEVRTQQIYIAETSLTTVAVDRIEWTARTRTTAPSNIDKEARALAGVVVDAMSDAGLITAN